MAINDMLSMPAYTDEMFQQGQTSIIPGQSLFQPSQLSLPGPMDTGTMGMMQMTPDQAAYENFFKANYNPTTGSDQLPGQWAAMTSEQKAAYSQSQAPGATAQMPALMTPPAPYGGLSMQQPSAVQQLNSPTLADIAQTQPFVPPTAQPMPMITQPPATQQAVAQIQAPVTNMPTTPVPVPQAPLQTQQLLRQIAAPVMTRTAFRPQQPSMSMRAPAPVQTDRLAPIRQSLAQLRPLRTQQPAVQPRRPAPISRVQPRLLPTPPMSRR
jgi:hypothetical protein